MVFKAKKKQIHLEIGNQVKMNKKWKDEKLQLNNVIMKKRT